jgi:hypothetical protein
MQGGGRWTAVKLKKVGNLNAYRNAEGEVKRERVRRELWWGPWVL